MPELSTHRTYIIVDGFSLIFRAFFGTRYMSTTDGRPTNALFGFASMLLALLENERPYGMVVVFDAPGKTFRHVEFPEYKGHRKEADPALVQQFPVTKELVNALGIDSLELAGFEADDLAGTVAKQVENAGLHALIVTGDMDQLQLASEGTTVRMTLRGISEVVDYTPEAVRERFGFGPELIPDYKALRGDPSDNIPGVAGIGEKTASALIQQFGPVEDILARIGEVPPKVRDKIAADPKAVLVGKRLTTIVCDSPVEFEPKPYRTTVETLEKAKRLFDSLEFRVLGRRLNTVLPRFADEPFTPPVQVRETLKAIATTAGSVAEVSLRFMGAQEVAVGFGADGVGLCIDGKTTFVPAEMDEALLWLNDAGAPTLLVHDGRSSLTALQPHGVEKAAFAFDSQLAGYVLAPGRGQYLLDSLAREHLGSDVAPDAASQASAIWSLREPMVKRLETEGTRKAFETVDMPLLPILIEIERMGIAVDPAYLGKLSDHLSIEADRLASDVYDLAGETFTIGSPKQLGYILFDKLKLPAGKKTKTGYSTDVDVLTSLATEHEICRKVLDWREVTKLKSTYADALPKLVKSDGRIHTTFLQIIAATGRLSSVEPNLQNIPVRSELGREIRRAFIAPPGKTLLSLDYSQIELRVLAHMCEDPGLLDAFDKGLDIHSATANHIYGTPVAEVSSDQRRVAKMVNYAVLYGMSDFGLAQALSIAVGEAHAVIDAYFKQFPRVKEFTDSIVQQARDRGYTITITGRKRYFPDITSANRAVRMGAERAAINAPIQGSSADVIKLAMIDLHKSRLLDQAQMLLQVHDELVFECAPDCEELSKQIAEKMERAAPLKVPLEVDAKVGPNWRDMK